MVEKDETTEPLKKEIKDDDAKKKYEKENRDKFSQELDDGGTGKVEKPRSRLQRCCNCVCTSLANVFRCVCFVCLPCIDYCCCDTKKIGNICSQISCECICFALYDSAMQPVRDCLDLIELPEFVLPWVNDGIDDWGDGGSYDIRMMFWDLDGNLRIGKSLRDRDEEILKILMTGTDNPDKDVKDEEETGDEVYVLLPSRWLREWVLFAHLRLSEKEPGKINLYNLLTKDKDEALGWRPNLLLEEPIAESTDMSIENRTGHYRAINLKTFLLFHRLYGVKGYPIGVWGQPIHDKRRWRVFPDVEFLENSYQDHLPKPNFVIEREAEEERKRIEEERHSRASAHRNAQDKSGSIASKGKNAILNAVGGVTNIFKFKS